MFIIVELIWDIQGGYHSSEPLGKVYGPFKDYNKAKLYIKKLELLDYYIEYNIVSLIPIEDDKISNNNQNDE